jgi:hypothetical protein
MNKDVMINIINTLESNRDILTNEINRLIEELGAMTHEEWKRMNPGLPMPADEDD